MRAVVLVFALMLLPLHPVCAQDLPTSAGSASLTPADVLEQPAPVFPSAAGRDRGRGALYGLAIGAVARGVGFAAMNYAFTESIPRDEFTVVPFGVGAAAGGAAGAVLGAAAER